MPDPRDLPELARLGLLLFAIALALVSLPNRALRRVAPLPVALAWRCRLASLGFVAAFLIFMRGLLPASAERDAHQYICVLTLGYGHLLGGVWFAGRRMAARVPAGVPAWLFTAFALANFLVLFSLYGWSHEHFPALLTRCGVVVFFFMFAVSNWHVVENDLAAARAYRRNLSLGSLSSGQIGHLVVGLTTLALTAAGVYLHARPGPLITFGDFFTGLVLYHVVAWLVFFGDRARRLAPAETARLLVRLTAVHALPAVLALGLVAWPGRELDSVRHAVFAPGIYALLSTLHVVQTAWVRGFEARRA